MQTLPTHKKWMLFFVVMLVVLSIATPVLADYLGPNRTVTQIVSSCKIILNECKYVESKGEWHYKNAEDWLCSNESKPWQDYSSNKRQCNASNAGYQYWSREDNDQQIITTYPAATISGSLQNCTLQNGWCVTPPELSLSANEPVSGYNVLAIEGTLNGQTFACPGGEANCNVPLSEGDNSLAYWALSSWGDSSTMGISNAQVDTVSPDVGLDISGSSGANGWYVSPVILTPTGSDSVSGLAGAFLSVDNGAWQSSATLNEGVYDIAITSSDNAGNVSNSSTTISVDTTTPSINVSINGTMGKNGWYRSGIQVSALASDATSGVGALEVAADGDAYQSYTSSISFSDGHHTIQFKATDNAGNVTEIPLQQFYVDTIAPSIDLRTSWELGTNVPYGVQDNGSGLAALRLVIEDEDEKYAKVAWDQTVSGVSVSHHIDWNGQFKDKTVAPPGTYLVWLKASDIAGNERIKLGKVIVPEPNVFLNLLQSNDASAETPVPPEDLIDDISPSTNSPTLDTSTSLSTGFGGSTTNKTETTNHSLFLTTGTAASIPSSSSSNVLWGAAAMAVIGSATAYALAERRKREEAEAEQAAQVAKQLSRDAEERAQKLQRQRENQPKQEDPSKQATSSSLSPEAVAAFQHGGAEAQKWINANKTKLQQEYQDSVKPHLDTKKMHPTAEDEKKIALQDAAQQKAEESKKAKNRQSESDAYDKIEKQRETNAVTHVKEKSWWDNTKSFLQEKIVQPVGKAISEKVYQPYVKSLVDSVSSESQNIWDSTKSFVQEKLVRPVAQNASLRKIALPVIATALTITGAANTYQWYQNVTQNLHLFDGVRQTMVEQLHSQVPSFFLDRKTKWQMLLSDPYTAAHDSVETLNIFMSGAANAGDAIWQQNPVVNRMVGQIKAIGDAACSQVSSEAWKRRCIGFDYGAAGLIEHPADSVLGLGESILINPMEGLLKVGVFSAQYNPVVLGGELIHGWQENGWQGLLNATQNHLSRIGQVLKDPQIQSFAMMAGIVLLIGAAALLSVPALVIASAMGLVAAVQTIWQALKIDQTIQQLPSLEEVKEYVASHQIRTFTVTSLFILALAALGVTKGVGDLQSFNGSLTTAAQESFASLSWWNRLQLLDAAEALNASPEALGFYLNESTRPGSSLASLPLKDALRVSSLAEQSGQGTLILDCLAKYGDDATPLMLKYGDDAVDIISAYGDNGIALLRKFGGDAKEAIALVKEFGTPATKVLDTVDVASAKLLLKTLDEDVLDYAIQQGPDAVEALSKWSEQELNEHGAELALRAKRDAEVISDLKLLVKSRSFDPAKLTKEQQELIRAIARNSRQYPEGGQVVVGKWIDIDSGFVKYADDTGSVNYNPHPEVWKLLSTLGKEKCDEVGWLINKEAIQPMIDEGMPFEYTLNDVPNVSVEQNLIEDMWQNNISDSDIMRQLKLDYMPGRIKELQTLQAAGYQLSFDELNNSYLLIKP